MLEWALIFLALSIIGGVLGFTSPAEISATVAKVLSGLYLLLFLALLVLGLMAGESFF